MSKVRVIIDILVWEFRIDFSLPGKSLDIENELNSLFIVPLPLGAKSMIHSSFVIKL